MMVQVDHSVTSLLGKAPGTLSLRICGGSLNGQIVRLQSSKCSLGSAPQCTLRLRAPGVDPLHCLILRGARGTIVRRFAAGTRLNGATFVDAPLRSGDRLSLGPIELKVLDDGQPEKDRIFVEDSIVETEDTAESEETVHLEQDVIGRDHHDQKVEELRSQTQQARSRTHRMLDELRSARRRIAELETLETESEAQQAKAADLHAQHERDRAIERTKLVCRVEGLSRELEQNASEKQASQRQLASLQDDLDATRQSVQDTSHRTTEERQAWELENQAHSQRTASLETELQQANAQLHHLEAERDTAVVESQCARTEADQQHNELLIRERHKWEAERETADVHFQQTQAEAEEQRRDWDQQREQWHAERQEQAEHVASLETELDRVKLQLKDFVAQHDAAEAESQLTARQAEQQHSELLESERNKWEAERADSDVRLQQTQSDIDEQQRTGQQEREQWQAERSAAHALLREDLDALEEERSKFEQQRNEWTENRQIDTEDVASTMQAALAEAEALGETRRLFEAEREESRSQCDQQRETLKQQRQAWQEECQRWKEQQAEQEQQLEQALLELKEHRDALEQSQVELDAQRTLEAQRLEASGLENNPLQESSSEGDNASAEDRESQLNDWCRHQEQVQQKRALDSDTNLEDSSSTDSATEVSESLQLDDHEEEDEPKSFSSILWTEEPSEQDEVSTPQTAAEITFEPVPEEPSLLSTTPPSEGDEEESIEEYMAKLLQRVQGKSGAPATIAAAPEMPKVAENSAVTTEVVPASQSVEQETPVVEPEPLRKRVEPFVMQRRSLPPELTSSLAAMRQLANSTAREAIDSSIQQRWLHAAIGKMMVGMTGLIGGVILLYWAPDYAGVTFLASLVAFLVAVFWGLQSAIIFRNLLTTPRMEGEDTRDATDIGIVETTAVPVQEPVADSLPLEEASDALENPSTDEESIGQTLPDDESDSIKDTSQ